MERTPYALLAVLLLVAFSSISYAQQMPSGAWSASSFAPGSSGSFTGTFYNQHGFELCTKSIVMAFSWGQSYNTTIPCTGAQNIQNFTIRFNVPSSISSGNYNYTITWYDQGYLAGNNATLNTGQVLIAGTAATTTAPITNTTVATTAPVTTTIPSGPSSNTTYLIIGVIAVIIIIIIAALAMRRKKSF